MKNKNIENKFSKILTKLRLTQQLSQKNLAVKLNIPVSTYRGYEYGNKFPAELIPSLSLALEVPLVQIFEDYKTYFSNINKYESSVIPTKKCIEETIKFLKKTLNSLEN